jgi:hypothetical protein
MGKIGETCCVSAAASTSVCSSTRRCLTSSSRRTTRRIPTGDLVTASIEEHLVSVRHADERPSRAERKQDAHTLVREILGGNTKAVRSGCVPGQSGPGSQSERSTGGWPRCSDGLGNCQCVKVATATGNPRGYEETPGAIRTMIPPHTSARCARVGSHGQSNS